MMHARFILCRASFALISVCLVSSVHAQTSGFTITNTTGQTLGNPPFTLGFEFQANTALTVSALGLFDDSQNGLAEGHNVGLFSSNGTLLASTSVLAGTANPLIDKFRYASIAPVLLTAGQNYRIGAVFASGADNLIFPGFATGFQTDPGITFVGPRYQVGATLLDPTASGGNQPGYFGPNLRISSTAVPEPGSMAFVAGLGIAGSAFALRRRRK